MNTTSASSSVLSWTDLFFDIPVKTTASSKTPNSATSKTILSGLTGSVKSGEMIAIMGPSGAGKTTLLNALSGRISAGGRLSGDILLNGKLREESSWKKLSAFGKNMFYFGDL